MVYRLYILSVRDRGRLGLEIEDPNYQDCGIEQPVMKTYKEIIHDEWFMPEIKQEEEIKLPVKLRWGGSEDAEGIAIPIHFEKILFLRSNVRRRQQSYAGNKRKMVYKSPKAKTVDLMSAFFEKPLNDKCDLTLKIFAPPANGLNDLSEEDGLFNSYTTLEKLPDIRVRFEPVEI